ncbi:MAG TPA: FtsX-like permease family protein [Cyclobacteriaceae bacterium]|nr:FtsX-like permease family protein [Cyclobacteriaceae bacterium]
MNSQIKIPPASARKFLIKFLRDDLTEEVLGDLEEKFYSTVKKKSLIRAKINYWFQVINYLRPFAMRKSMPVFSNPNFANMFKHNLTISYRGFIRYKMSFIINLIGLSTGLAFGLLVYLWVLDEMNFDKFHKNDSRLYQVMENSHDPEGISTSDISPALLAKALSREMPEVEYAVSTGSRFFSPGGIISHGDKRLQVKGLYASQAFFQAFSFNMLQGNKNTVLEDLYSIVISESMAIKLFGTLDEVRGKIVTGNRDLFDREFIITGVFEDPPFNSTLQFDFVLNHELAFVSFPWLNEWTAGDSRTYIVLREGTDAMYFNEKIINYIETKYTPKKKKTLFIRQFSKGYLWDHYENGVQAGGRIEYVRLFSVAAIFTLLIACINFINLATAQAFRKMKEVGIKKAIGVSRKSLVFQFLEESLIMTILSFLVSIPLVYILLPQVNKLTGRDLNLFFDLNILISITLIIVISGILSGIYPAYYLSGFKPGEVIKGKLASPAGEAWVRKALVIFQFSISVIFIAGFLIIEKQIEYVRAKDLGYDRKNVIHFKKRGPFQRETFLLELNKISGVISATNSHGGSIVGMEGSGIGFSWEGNPYEEEIIFQRPQVGYDFIETLGIEVLTGRTFSKEFGDESSNLIVSESAAKVIGQENIIGRTIWDGPKQKQVIGVVRDFHIKSLHEKTIPCIIRFDPNGNDYMVRIEPGEERVVIQKIEGLYDKFDSEYPFEFSFIDAEYQDLYLTEKRFSLLSKYLTGIAIIISCLGLFGMAAFTVNKRTKEIGIRKILGAGEFSIVRLITGDFTKIIIIAILIAMPISYLLTRNWLNGYAYRIELKWWYFTGAGMLALLIAWITIGIQTFKAIRVNPVECLRNE